MQSNPWIEKRSGIPGLASLVPIMKDDVLNFDFILLFLDSVVTGTRRKVKIEKIPMPPSTDKGIDAAAENGSSSAKENVCPASNKAESQLDSQTSCDAKSLVIPLSLTTATAKRVSLTSDRHEQPDIVAPSNSVISLPNRKSLEAEGSSNPITTVDVQTGRRVTMSGDAAETESDVKSSVESNSQRPAPAVRGRQRFETRVVVPSSDSSRMNNDCKSQ